MLQEKGKLSGGEYRLLQNFNSSSHNKPEKILYSEIQILHVEFQFELEMHETFHSIPIRFCCRFLTTVKMEHHEPSHGTLYYIA